MLIAHDLMWPLVIGRGPNLIRALLYAIYSSQSLNHMISIGHLFRKVPIASLALLGGRPIVFKIFQFELCCVTELV
jgi:hypothetical protein